MFVCPKCHVAMQRRETPTGILWICGTCQSRLAQINDDSLPDAILRVLHSPLESKLESKWTCPVCKRKMQEISVVFSGLKKLRIDVCRGCGVFWFDAGEYEEMLEGDSQEQSRMVATSIMRPPPTPVTGSGDETLAYICGALGLPVEVDEPIHTKPFFTWTLSAILLICGFVFSSQSAAEQYGFMTGDPWRLFGLTWITCFFIHGGLWHLLSNVYFFMIFGDNVEEYLGKGRFAVLLVLSTLSGNFLYLLRFPGLMVPSIGASGGIAGVMIFYCLSFPKAQIGFLYRILWNFRWFTMPAYALGLFWFLLQIVGAKQESTGMTQVNYFAHLGGVLAGVLFWAIAGRSSLQAQRVSA